MSSKGLLCAFIFEAVIDATKTFRDKRSADLQKKVGDVVASLPDAFQKQDRQENWMAARLEAVEDIPQRYISQKRLRMAIPSEFSEDEWGPQGRVFDVIGYAYPEKDFWPQLSQFAIANEKQFLLAVEAIEKEMDDIANEADAMEWPAPWRRYTNYNPVQSSVYRFVENVKKLLRKR